MADQPDAMDTQTSPPGPDQQAANPGPSASGSPSGSAPAVPPVPADIPQAFPKKRRGRPPGRPNTTVREADYEDNPLVQTWNAAKSGQTMKAVPIHIREALTEEFLQHDTQRAVFRDLPSREVIYFEQGWITAKHIASKRPSYVNGLLIHSRGRDAPVSCATCADRRAKGSLGPFLQCRVIDGQFHNSCSNCKWFDNTSACSLFTGPKPNRKRKKPDAGPAPVEGGPTNGDGGYAPQGGGGDTFMDHHVADAAIDPALQLHVDQVAGMQQTAGPPMNQAAGPSMHQTTAPPMHQAAVAPMHQATEAHFGIHGDERDLSLLENV